MGAGLKAFGPIDCSPQLIDHALARAGVSVTWQLQAGLGFQDCTKLYRAHWQSAPPSSATRMGTAVPAKCFAAGNP